MHINVFERPITGRWVYPCSVDDIRLRLLDFHTEDLSGLWAVGLVPSTHKSATCNAKYFGGNKPVIHIYSYPDTLRFRQPASITLARADRGLVIEKEYGMRLEQRVTRVECVWEAEDLRAFILDYVLAHEIGHHVSYRARSSAGHNARVDTRWAEEIADHYARNHIVGPARAREL